MIGEHNLDLVVHEMVGFRSENLNFRRCGMRKLVTGIAVFSLVILVGLAGVAQDKLVIWCHSVHQQVAEGTRGAAAINVVEPFEDKFGVTIEWVTIPWSQMQDKVLRELSLSRSEVDIVFLVDLWATPGVFRMLEPLDSYQATKPIEDFEGLAPGMVKALTYEGSLYGVPVRSNMQVLHYNEAIFSEKGIAGAPSSFEKLIEVARVCTYVREDGAQVYGLGLKIPEDILAVIWAYGGDVMTLDYEVKCDQPEAIRAITVLRDLYAAGAIPPNFTVLGSADYQRLVSDGLVSMVFFGDNYYFRFNDPERSNVAGHMQVAPIPASEETGLTIAPCKVAFWSMAIPKNGPAEHKELAWEFIRYLASPEVQLQMALNGNGPTRLSVFEDPTYAELVPYAWVDQQIVNVARPLWPPFDRLAEARDIFAEQATLAIVGVKDPEKAMHDAAEAIRNLVSQK